MRDKRLLWFASILFGLTIMFGLMIKCKPKGYVILESGDAVTFVTHDDGRTEIMLICLNLSDRYVFGVVAEVTIGHIETKEIIDRVVVSVGMIIPRGVTHFSAWTDRLIFGDNVGVRVSFTYGEIE